MEIFIDLHYEIIYKIQANKTKNHRNHCCYNPQPNPSYPNNLLPYLFPYPSVPAKKAGMLSGHLSVALGQGQGRDFDWVGST